MFNRFDDPKTSDYSLFNLLSDGIITVADGQIKDINLKACGIFRLDRQEILNQPIYQVIPELTKGTLTSDGIIFVNNKALWVKVLPTLIGYNILVQDTTQTEEALRHLSNDNFRQMAKFMDACDDGYAIMDKERTVVYINTTQEGLLGVRAQDIINSDVNNLIKEGVVNMTVTPEVLKSRQSMVFHQLTRSKGGILSTGIPVYDKSGEILYVVATSRDMIRLKNLDMATKPRPRIHRIDSSSIAANIFIKTLKDEGYVVESKAMVNTISKIANIVNSDVTVLITGETGVGKEVIANILHEKGPRKERSFVKVNCGAIPHELLESEMFGYEGGAFTGARKEGKPGLFELANSGTIFLDEITALPMLLQTKLLRVLQEQEIMRVGGLKTIKINTRIIAAANDLNETLDKGQFRKDLFYRLNIIRINVPPLRDRPEDITPLTRRYLEKFNRKYNKNVSFSQDALAVLNLYSWPGNVRELNNLIERCVVLCNQSFIEAHDLPREIRPNAINQEEELKDLKQVLYDTEKDLILKAMSFYGSTRKAARALGVSQPTIVRKLQQYSSQPKEVSRNKNNKNK